MMIVRLFYGSAAIRWLLNIIFTLCLAGGIFIIIWRPVFTELDRHSSLIRNQIKALLANGHQTEWQITDLFEKNTIQQSSLDKFENNFVVPSSFQLAQEVEAIALKSDVHRHVFLWQKEDILPYYKNSQFELRLSGTFSQLSTFFSLSRKSEWGYLVFTYSYWQRDKNLISVNAKGHFYQGRGNENE